MNLSMRKHFRGNVRGWRRAQRLRTMKLEVLEQRRLLAGPALESIYPLANSHTAPLDTAVVAAFDQDIDPASVSDTTFAVHAMQSGRLLEPDNVFDASGSIAIVNPAADFHPGELVQTTATTGIQNFAGESSPAAFVWQFRTETTGGTGYFRDSGQSLADSWNRSVALGDLDGDGDLDAFVANPGPNKVWLNDGRGNFTDSGQSLGESSTFAVALGDLDGDGDLDAFAANKVWVNDGQGIFSDSGQQLGDAPTLAVALADLDGDGDLDAFVGTGRWSPSTVWLNDGEGRFAESGQWLGNYVTSDVALGDLDGDGDVDAFVVNVEDDDDGKPNVVWLNDGQGHFSDSGQSLGGDSYSLTVALGDLDGDGDLDAFIGNILESEVWLNDGQGHFSDSGQAMDNGNDDEQVGVALGDLDADGDLDAFLATGDGASVWFNDGQARFSSSGEELVGESDNYGAVALGDLDGDGDLDAAIPYEGVWLNANAIVDLAVAKSDGHLLVVPGQTVSYVVTATNNGPVDVSGATVTDIFAPELSGVTWTGTASAGSSCTASGSGDIHDSIDLLVGGSVTYIATGTLDPAARGTLNNLATVTAPMDLSDSISANDTDSDSDAILDLPVTGRGGYFADSGQRLWDADIEAVALGDVDGDGDLDAFVANDDDPNTVWLNDGQGTFSDSGQRLGEFDSEAVALGDLDGDGDLDAFVTGDDPDKVWLNDGRGNFSDSGQRLGDFESAGVALGDLDGDGDLDAFVANEYGPNKVWVNDGQGQFSDSGQWLEDWWTIAAVALGDLDGDGDLDAFVGNEWGANTVWLNDGQGHFSDSGQRLGNSDTADVALGDLDGDGDLDAFVVNDEQPNQVWLNDGQGVFSDSGQSLGSAMDREAVALGDVDSDGDLDAFVPNDEDDDDNPAPNEVWLNDGRGNFSDSGQRLGYSESVDVALGDLDGDGDLDAFVANSGSGPNKVWLNVATAVVRQHIFYNNSVFDGNDPAANRQDDQAIAPDKQALLPGETATFANYTSYGRGINGIMVDVAGLRGTPTAEDFDLMLGNSNDLSTWVPAPNPSTVAVRPGEGVNGSDRITLIWPDNAIQKEWLQITVLVTDNTGLEVPDVFYFGNAIGESGDSTTDAKVNIFDMLGARDNQRTFLDPAPIDFAYDFNRDARVNTFDMLLARDNQTHFLNALKLISVPGSRGPRSPISRDGETGENGAAHDAVLQQPGRYPLRPRETFGPKGDWLFELEQIRTQRRVSREDDSHQEAADLLLTIDWP